MAGTNTSPRERQGHLSSWDGGEGCVEEVKQADVKLMGGKESGMITGENGRKTRSRRDITKFFDM